MGCCNSRLESQESVSRCQARRRYMKQLLKARQSFSFSHSLYLHSLRSTGSALLQFADAESLYYNQDQTQTQNQTQNPDRNQNQTPLPPPPPHPPPLSPCALTWVTNSSSASPILPPPPPPPPHSWDFWDPFAPSSSHSITEEEEEEWEDEVVTVNASQAPSRSSPSVKDSNVIINNNVSNGGGGGLAMVVSPKSKKDFGEVVKELDEYFLKAADAGSRVSALLESPSCLLSSSSPGVMGKIGSYGRSLNPWGSNSKACSSNRFTRFERSSEEESVIGMISVSHSSTVEKLYAWERKLYLEVKNSEKLREEREKRVNLLRKQELKGVDYVKVEKNKREIESLESKMMVASQAMETTSSEITRLREAELFPQLLELLNGLTGMWRSMYECHQVQTHIVQQLNYLTISPLSSNAPTSDIHRQSTLQLEIEVDRWYSSFCNLVKSQRDYIHSLTGWLRLSLFQSYSHLHHHLDVPHSKKSNIYATCEEWYLALDQIPDKVASEGIKSFLTVIHAIVLQQGEEQKQKKRSELAFKDLDKKMNELRSLESKYGPYFSSSSPTSDRSNPVTEKRAKVDSLKVKAEEEKAKYEKCSGMTRAMTINNLQTGFPNVFQAITGFSSVCMQAFEEVYTHHQRSSSQMNLKLLTYRKQSG